MCCHGLGVAFCLPPENPSLYNELHIRVDQTVPVFEPFAYLKLHWFCQRRTPIQRYWTANLLWDICLYALALFRERRGGGRRFGVAVVVGA